jgi:hypothetical protein
MLVVVSLASGAHAQEEGGDKEQGTEVTPKASPSEMQLELLYAGELIDEESTPVAGVFPLVFKLYSDEKAKKVLWSEAHFVAVANGTYSLVLGRQSPLPAQAAQKSLSLGVELDGHELFRQTLRAEELTVARRGSVGASAVAYASRCGDAESLGGMRPEDFAPASVVTELQQHVANVKMHGAASAAAPAETPSVGGTTLSGQAWKSDWAGGTGGKLFTLSCPAGYVMTGLEGKSGAVIDSIRVICTRLE